MPLIMSNTMTCLSEAASSCQILSVYLIFNFWKCLFFPTFLDFYWLRLFLENYRNISCWIRRLSKQKVIFSHIQHRNRFSSSKSCEIAFTFVFSLIWSFIYHSLCSANQETVLFHTRSPVLFFLLTDKPIFQDFDALPDFGKTK